MRLLFIHTHVLEELSVYGIDVDNYGRHFGYEHRFARLFRSKGYEADLVIFSKRFGEVHHLTHVWGHRIFFAPIRGFKGLRQLRLVPELVKMLSDYDIVHCFSYYSNIYDVLALSCWAKDFPLVAQSQGIFPTIGGFRWFRKFLSLRVADRLLPLTRSEARFLMSRFKISSAKITVVPNFIMVMDYRFSDRLSAREVLGIGNDEFVVLTVCRLVPEKGVQTLLRAASALKGRIGKLKVMIVGEGPYRPVLERMVDELGLREIVRFLGFVHNRDVGMYYSSADCFVLASHEESFGIVLLEAMLYGLPVVASRTWGAEEIIDDTGTGLLFPPGDELSLSMAIERIYADLEEARKIGEQGRRLVMERFTADEIFKKLDRVYRQVRDE